MNKELFEALNWQISIETNAYIFYMDAATEFASECLYGFSEFLEESACEELAHADKIRKFLLKNGEKPVVNVNALNGTSTEELNPLLIFDDILRREKEVTVLINGIIDMAFKAGEYATVSFMQSFVDEQLKSVKEISDIIQKIKMIGDDNGALLALDAEFKNRNK